MHTNEKPQDSPKEFITEGGEQTPKPFHTQEQASTQKPEPEYVNFIEKNKTGTQG
jgi:hypothetical protein